MTPEHKPQHFTMPSAYRYVPNVTTGGTAPLDIGVSYEMLDLRSMGGCGNRLGCSPA